MQTSRRADSLVQRLVATCMPFCRALCEPSRITLVGTLLAARRPCTVSELAARLPVDLSVVSRHLGLMRDAGVVTAERRGREMFYAVDTGNLVRTLRALADMLEEVSA